MSFVPSVVTVPVAHVPYCATLLEAGGFLENTNGFGHDTLDLHGSNSVSFTGAEVTWDGLKRGWSFSESRGPDQASVHTGSIDTILESDDAMEDFKTVQYEELRDGPSEGATVSKQPRLLGGVAGDPQPMRPQPGVAPRGGGTAGQAGPRPPTGEGFQPPPQATVSGRPATQRVQEVPFEGRQPSGSDQSTGNSYGRGGSAETPGAEEPPRGGRRTNSGSFFSKYFSPQQGSLPRKSAQTRLASEQSGTTPAGPSSGVRLDFISPQQSTVTGSPATEGNDVPSPPKECCPPDCIVWGHIQEIRAALKQGDLETKENCERELVHLQTHLEQRDGELHELVEGLGEDLQAIRPALEEELQQTLAQSVVRTLEADLQAEAGKLHQALEESNRATTKNFEIMSQNHTLEMRRMEEKQEYLIQQMKELASHVQALQAERETHMHTMSAMKDASDQLGGQVQALQEVAGQQAAKFKALEDSNAGLAREVHALQAAQQDSQKECASLRSDLGSLALKVETSLANEGARFMTALSGLQGS